jgi:serine/threonine kinase 32
MLLYEAQVKPQQLPPGFSPDAASFINRLLKRKAAERLGSKGIEEVLAHPWLKEIDWNKMLSKKYPSPFLPNF